MRSLLKAIFLIPKMLINLIWSIVWSLVKVVVFFGIVFFGLVYYAHHSDSQFAKDISTTVDTVTSIISRSQDTSSEGLIDQFSNTSNARWSKASATYYIKTTNPTLIAAYQSAIETWNGTGVFSFVEASSESDSDIILDENSDSSSQAAGLAEMKTNPLTNRFKKVTVTLNTYYLLENDYGYSQDRIVNTAEHELGHAIGLNHDDDEESVMQSSGSYYSIQATDIEKVRELYAN